MRTSYLLAFSATCLMPAVALADPPAAPANPVAAAAAALPPAVNPDQPAAREIDTTIPDTPGFAVIGLTPATVIDPGAFRVASFDITNYVDDKGKLKPGLAIAGTPYFWFNHSTLSQYRAAVEGSWATGVLARTSVSLGYTKAADGKTDLIGLGFATELLGDQKQPGKPTLYADYRLDTALSDCIGKEANARIEPLFGTQAQFRTQAYGEWHENAGDLSKLPAVSQPTQDRDRWIFTRENDLADAKAAEARKKIAAGLPETGMPDAVKACRSEAAARYAKRVSLVVAGGWALRSNPKPGESTSDGGSLWASYRRPLGLAGTFPNYLTLFSRYDFDRKAEIPGGFQDFDKLSAALVLGYEWASPKGSNPDRGGGKLSLQGGYEKIDYHGAGPLKDAHSGFYAATFDYQIAKSTWIELKAGAGSLDPAGGKGKADKITFGFRQSLGPS